MQNPRPECAAHASQSKRGHPRPALTVLSPCMQMQLQELGALPAHFPPCSGCGQPRPHKSSHHAKQKPNWLCKSCTAAPKCGNCAGPLPRNAEAGTWCATCAYPPCSGGCGEPRPHERRYHAQHKPLWLCQACSVRNGYPPCPMCGLQRPQERRYHVKVMPHWTCEACTVKSCPKCGEVRGSKAQTGALCLACAYPPCESCGSQRPQESRYRVNVMPQWTCEACSVKSCPKVRAKSLVQKLKMVHGV